MLIERQPLRMAVRDVLRDWIVGGKLSAEARLTEPAIAAELGVSRTPLREALIHLERDGLLCLEAGRGFIVQPICEKMVRETYPILASLECMALKLAGADTKEDVAELRRINQRIRASDAIGGARFELDRDWHKRLVRRCPNPRLIAMIDDLKYVARRCDGADRRGLADVAGSCAQHDGVMDAIEVGDVALASQRLEDHWFSGIETVVAWLNQASS